MPDVNADHRRSSTNSALGYSFLVVPLLVFLVLLTNKLDETVKISFFAATSPLFLTFFTLIITSFGTRGEPPRVSSSILNAQFLNCRWQPILVRTEEASVPISVLRVSLSAAVW